VVTLTDAAKEHVKKLLREPEQAGKEGLRLGIKGGGCSGLSYLIEFDTEKEGDTVLEHDGFKVFLDRKSTIYLAGVTLDYKGGLQGKGLVFQNPNATNTCGCGESFSL
jgi:iron-sulfur cluster assembly protein